MKLKKIKNNLKVCLNADEQVTFVIGDSKFDVTKKDWGFYASPSIQKRCLNNGLKAAIIFQGKNCYVVFVKKNKEKKFFSFIKKNKYNFLDWIYNSKYFSKYFN
jgi:hypothetical protein